MRWNERLAAARDAKGLTQAEVAERVGVDRSLISKMEGGQHFPTIPDQLNAVCNVLGVSAETLLREGGVVLTPPAAARLPRVLIDALLELTPEQLVGLTALAIPAAEQNKLTRRSGQ